MTDLFLDFTRTDDVFNIALATENGDIKTDDGLKSAVLYSLFTDRLANTDDAIPDGSANRRGHWGDAFLPDDNDSEGSRLWLLAREKQTTQTLNRAIEYAEEALQWLIDDLIASAVTVTAEWLRTGVLVMQIQIDVINAENFTDTFEVTL